MPASTLTGAPPTRRPSAGWPPWRRPAKLQIPYTTGILVGIGESRADRIEALEAIAESHRRWGHIQEVIVQNFLPKPGKRACSTGCRARAPTTSTPSLWPG